MKNTKMAAVLRLLLFILLLGLITLAFLHYASFLTVILKNPEILRQRLLACGSWSRLIFISLQILQVLVAFLPGEVVQISGGYIYGIVMGTIYSIIGILLGSLAVFSLSRWLGHPFLQTFIIDRKEQQFDALFNSKKAEIITFLFFLIPGAPKDILTYLAGLSPMRFGNFLTAAMLGRLPGIIISSLIGAQLESRQYLPAGILAALASLLFLLGFIFQDKFFSFLFSGNSAAK